MLQTEGLEIKSRKVYFRFIGIAGDNLGLHQILGFVESFSANYPCRMCRIDKIQLKTCCVEVPELLRNKDNYEEDLNLNDVSATGLKRNSVLNKIGQYHVTSNDIVDIVHDVAEGIANFGMAEILHFFLQNDILNLEQLNQSIKHFKFGYKSNRPPPLKIHNINRKDLALSASEVINLVLYFGLIIGHHIPSLDEVWNYYSLLHELVNILLLKTVSREIINYLESLIAEHHRKYQNVFGTKLKPKHHFLIHYPRLLRKLGPMCHLWTMRFEGQHLEYKFIAQSARSRINLCKSLATRNMFAFAADIYFLQKEDIFKNVGEVGPRVDNSENNCKWLTYKYRKYSVNDYVSLFEEKEGMPTFGKIKIINLKNDTVTFCLCILCTLDYSDHLKAYIIKDEDLGEVNLQADSVSEPLVHCYRYSNMYIANVGI